jgi:hypothetical protein
MMRLTLWLAIFFVAGHGVGQASEEKSEHKQSVAAKLAVPDDAARAKALGVITQIFGEDYKDRKNKNRQALVLKLLKQADDPANDSAMQYVLLTEAARIAAEAGDLEAALSAVKAKGSRFEENPLRLKLDVLSVASKATSSPVDQTALVEAWTLLAREAVCADVFDVAERAARAACNAAQKTKKKDLALLAVQEQQHVKAAGRLFAAMLEARARLETKPDDFGANSVVGRYLCIVKGRWDDGLPYLAKGDNVEWRAAAETDIGTPKEAEK